MSVLVHEEGTAWRLTCPACGKMSLIGEPYSRHVMTVGVGDAVSTNGSIICQQRTRGRKCEAHFTVTRGEIVWHGTPPVR